MASDFERWEKDPFFSAAEEVQESADRYRFCLVFDFSFLISLFSKVFVCGIRLTSYMIRVLGLIVIGL